MAKEKANTKRERKLTAKQEAYKNARIAGMNLTDAYIHAYSTKSMSRKCIYIEAYKLEQHPQVSLYIAAGSKVAETSAIMTRSEALERLSTTARVTITDVCDFKLAQVGEDEEGNPVYQTVWTIKNSEDIPPEVAVSIKSVSITKSGPKLELHDQNAAIKQLTDMQGWNSPKKFELEADGVIFNMNFGSKDE